MLNLKRFISFTVVALIINITNINASFIKRMIMQEIVSGLRWLGDITPEILNILGYGERKSTGVHDHNITGL
jgi:hypothetical protein